MTEKLRRKFTLTAVLSITLVLILILGIINLVNYRKFLLESGETLQLLDDNNGVFPGMGAAPEDEGAAPPALPDHMNPEEPFQTRYFSILTDREGNILHTDYARIAAVDEGSAREYVKKVQDTRKREGFVGTYRFKISEKTDTMMFVFLDCSKELASLSDFMITCILIGLGGLAMVFALVWFFSGRVVKPFVENYEKQKRFITDAGHEIKTPLTIISADLSVLEMDMGTNEWTEDIHRQTERLKDLTNDLVYLARTEEAGADLAAEDFCISGTAEKVVESFRGAFTAGGKNLTAEIEPKLMLHGDRKGMERLFSILLDNALKYSTDGGTVLFRLKKKGKNVLLEIQNPCAPITKEQTEKLFDRFYRTDASRNSETGGHGIGLSIAKAVVEKQNGKITASTPDGNSLHIQAVF